MGVPEHLQALGRSACGGGAALLQLLEAKPCVPQNKKRYPFHQTSVSGRQQPKPRGGFTQNRNATPSALGPQTMPSKYHGLPAWRLWPPLPGSTPTVLGTRPCPEGNRTAPDARQLASGRAAWHISARGCWGRRGRHSLPTGPRPQRRSVWSTTAMLPP